MSCAARWTHVVRHYGGQELRPSRFKIGGLCLGILGVLTVAACGGSSAGGGGANANILHFPFTNDPSTQDPGILDQETESELAQNAFDNLWRFDNKLTVVPDIATTVPSASNGGISSDGLTYTVHLRQGVTFNNGDAVTSKDVLYSFNRSVALRGPYASNLAAIAGYSAVRKAAAAFCAKGSDVNACHATLEQKLSANDPTVQMSGLTAPDQFTVMIKLSSTCGWCLAAWSLQATTATIVDENVIKNDPVNWWTKSGGPGVTDGQVGTGAFYMSAYVPKQSLTYKPVSNWWGSPKPTLTQINIDIKADESTFVSTWEQGTYDLIGYGGDSSLPLADVLRVKQNAQESPQLLLVPKGRTTWLSFNIGYPATGGPFVGESAAAKGLRKAMALSVDLNALVQQVCKGLTCAAQNGGLITKGLVGYLGDNADPLAHFDASTAKSLLHQYDPDGSKTAALKYSYNSDASINQTVAQFLQGQWQTNLGINVALDPHPDGHAFINDRLAGKFVMARDGWQFDYNHPQDWYDNLWGTSACGGNTSGYADNGSCGDGATDSNPTYDNTLTQADGLPIDQGLPLYNQLATQMQTDVAYLPLYYSVGQFMIHPYVHGAGSTAQADYYWNGITVDAH
ncbi:MAG TPA: ABC transporter substrate-binding protein [Candidatus Dormibacteraeota bacterium]